MIIPMREEPLLLAEYLSGHQPAQKLAQALIRLLGRHDPRLDPKLFLQFPCWGSGWEMPRTSGREHKKNGRPVEGEGWSGGAEEGRRREPPELCARPV